MYCIGILGALLTTALAALLLLSLQIWYPCSVVHGDGTGLQEWTTTVVMEYDMGDTVTY